MAIFFSPELNFFALTFAFLHFSLCISNFSLCQIVKCNVNICFKSFSVRQVKLWIRKSKDLFCVSFSCFAGGRGWREEGSGDRKLFILRVSFYLWETSARTITESVVSRCVMCEPFFQLWSNTTASSAELRGSIWTRTRNAQNETVCEPGRLTVGGSRTLVTSGENQTFFTVLSLLHRPLRLVFVPHFSSVSLTSCFHETSLPQLKRSGEISPDQRADFSFFPRPGLT